MQIEVVLTELVLFLKIGCLIIPCSDCIVCPQAVIYRMFIY